MRRWIEHLVGNQAACEDFLTWASDIDTDLKDKLMAAVREDNMSKARALSIEIGVYDNINKKIKAELRERTAQAHYNTETAS